MPLDHVALRFSRNSEADEAASIYRGIRYRSKRHAQWAVFFDALGLDHVYEPRAFRFGRGVSLTPDFWLPELNAWLIVKSVDAVIRDVDRWKAELFSREHPEFRVWLSNGVPRAGEWHLEQLGPTPVKCGMLLADANDPSRMIWVCGANDEHATKLVFDAIETATGRSAPQPRTFPADPKTNSLMRMAYGQVEHFQAESWSPLGAITGQMAKRRMSPGISPM
jgi:hypothetical protein